MASVDIADQSNSVPPVAPNLVSQELPYASPPAKRKKPLATTSNLIKEQELSTEEKQKKEKRRQNNSQAAARYRQKKDDTIKQQQEEIQKNKIEINKLKEIIKSLQEQNKAFINNIRVLEENAKKCQEQMKLYDEKVQDARKKISHMEEHLEVRERIIKNQRALIDAVSRESNAVAASKVSLQTQTDLVSNNDMAISEPLKISRTVPSVDYLIDLQFGGTENRHNSNGNVVASGSNLSGQIAVAEYKETQRTGSQASAVNTATLQQSTSIQQQVVANSVAGVPHTLINCAFRPQQIRLQDIVVPTTYHSPTLTPNHVFIPEKPPAHLKLPTAVDTQCEDPLAFLRASRPRPGIAPAALVVPKGRLMANRKGRPRLDETTGPNQRMWRTERASATAAKQLKIPLDELTP